VISAVSRRTSPYRLEKPLPNMVNPDSNRDVQEVSSCSDIVAEDEQQYQEIGQVEEQRSLNSNTAMIATEPTTPICNNYKS
jgi:hypothetical protein